MRSEHEFDQQPIVPATQHETVIDLRNRIYQQEQEIEALVSQLVETQDQLLAMYDLSKTTRSHLGLAETLRHLAREATRLVCVEGALLCVGPMLVHYPEDLIDDPRLTEYIHTVQTRGAALVLDAAHVELPAGVTNFCLLPITLKANFTAVFGLINRAGGFTAPDLKLAQAIVDQAGAYIEHALLYQESLEQTRLQTEFAIARQVQLQLLPQSPPNIATLDIYAESRPALQVGGDFYDFVMMPDRPLMLLLGDVAGKGVSAAMIMGLIHTATRSAARFMPEATPATVLSRTNNDLYDDLTLLDAFATTFVAQYLAEQRQICYANAGHAPVIYRPPGGSSRLLEADGVPVGVLPTSLSEDQILEFPTGALLVVTTDGFSEVRDPNGKMFGYERLLELVDTFANQPAQVIAYELYNAIDSFANGKPREDDETLLIIKGIEKR